MTRLPPLDDAIGSNLLRSLPIAVPASIMLWAGIGLMLVRL